MKTKNIAIDDDEVLYSYYDDRETFVVDFDEDLVEIVIEKGNATFRLKRR